MVVSISQVKCFKACRRAYFFNYIEGLEPVEKAEALQIGTKYHEMLEAVNTGNSLVDFPDCKEKAMALAYARFIYPQLEKIGIYAVEQEIDCGFSARHDLIGRVDGIMEDGSVLEHKTTSAEITPQYEYNLMWDEQILAYMAGTGARKIYYTVIRKPTIRQKKDETDADFFERMLNWYESDTDSKIKLLIIERTEEEVEQFMKDLEAICDEMENTHLLYRNTGWCTVWGRR